MARILSNSTYLKISYGDLASSSEHYFNDTYVDVLGSTSMSSGSYRDSLYVVIPVTIIYAAIFLTGIIGNVSTCIVIARNKSMHTATNYYLFSLAVSDLLLLVSGLPAEMYLVWCKYPYIFGEGFCVLRGLASETSTNASVLTIASFTVERYVAICHPFLSQTLSNLSRAIKLILIIWLVALLFALPQALQFGVVRHNEHPDMVMCTVKRIIVSHSFELSTFLFFVIPMCLITFLYVLIGLKLRKSNMTVPGRTESRNCRHYPGRSSRRVLKMLVAVVIAFFICWAPFHVQRLIAIYGTNTEDHITSNGPWMEFLYLLMTYVSGVFYYVSTTINPILYNIMSNKFRIAFMSGPFQETLSKSFRLAGLPAHNEQRSYSSLSRSQQKTIGAYGSRIAEANGESDIIADSNYTEGSRNSLKESQQQSIHNPENLSISTRVLDATQTNSIRSEHAKNNNDILPKKNNPRLLLLTSGHHKNRSIHRNQEASWIKKTKYKNVHIKMSNIDSSDKKWWRFFKWFPDLKVLRFSRSSTVPEDRVFDENPREELSMTMWNVRDNNKQRFM
ncbi:PREDICTED: neuromedin-U receptor 2-like [Atta cephalotes]|uniref:G-protein coupled receptors family 1 profile domain-containing protein n=1 Tax=Atta cephalotes TaxID=12957 RepID=A0A158NC00_ATTCE|nr:PREDICTED: neuromedin-U receptor 2-like [Atta cephalotes]